MYFNAHLLFLPGLFLTSGALAQLSAVATSYTPDITYPPPVNGVYDAFVFCSAPDCSGTCEAENVENVPDDNAEAAPNDMGFQSIYYYDPTSYVLQLYTCLAPGCGDAVEIGPNTCYNLYDNGVPTDFYTFYFFPAAGPVR